ncbi:MAG: hypothetical protein Q4D06_04545 [Coriobacteriia bacterium]|nr:hypothetical protein [Coriobacteriia bacterium]
MVLRKLTDQSGESLVESLLGVLVACLAFVFLCTAVVVAARVNATVTNQDTAFTLAEGGAAQAVDVRFSVEGDLPGTYAYTYGGRALKQSQDQEYVYYE